MRTYDNGIYRDMTDEEIKEMSLSIPPELEIESLKQQLTDTDYIAIKYAEGWISEADYAPTKELRQNWRDEINKLEVELKEMDYPL